MSLGLGVALDYPKLITGGVSGGSGILLETGDTLVLETGDRLVTE